jgi:hypothetical protein
MSDLFKYAVRLAKAKMPRQSFDVPEGAQEQVNPEFFVKQERIPTFTDWMRDLKLKEAFKDLEKYFNQAQRGDLKVEDAFKSLPELDHPVADAAFFRGKNPNPSKLTKGYYLLFPFKYLRGEDAKKEVFKSRKRQDLERDLFSPGGEPKSPAVKKLSPAQKKLEDLFSKAASMEPEAAESLSPAATAYVRDLRALWDQKAQGRSNLRGGPRGFAS